MRAVLDIRHDLPFRRSIGTQLVRDHALWCEALFRQQPGEQALGGLIIAAVLDDLIENISILDDSPPQPMFLAGDGDEDFVQVPNIIGAGPLPAQSANILRAELLPPTPDRFVGDDDAALQQHFLDQAQAQGNR